MRVMKSGFLGKSAGIWLAGGIGLCVLAGCTRPAHRLEVHWYTPGGNDMQAPAPADGESWVEMRKCKPRMATLRSATDPIPEGDYTVYTLPPGQYEFEYMVPDSEMMLYGELDVHDADSDAVRQFIRRTFVTISPGAPGEEPGFLSVLSTEDMDRVRRGDMVTKVLFVADLKAIDGRLDMIERELRRIQDLEARYNGQLEYWKVKLAERRRNAFYNTEYGADIPSGGLAALQALVGAETYHWVRYTEAEDKVRTYEESLAELDLPAQRLREERAALRGMLTSAKVVHRRNEMMLASYQMQRQFHDAVDEVREKRHTLNGPERTIVDPYAASAITKSMGYPRWLTRAVGMSDDSNPVGEVVLVMRLGPRMLVGR